MRKNGRRTVVMGAVRVERCDRAAGMVWLQAVGSERLFAQGVAAVPECRGLCAQME